MEYIQQCLMSKYNRSIVVSVIVPIYTLCGDNIDKTIKRRYLQTDSNTTATSLHYFHFYAVKDRIDFSDLGEKAILCDADQLHLVLVIITSIAWGWLGYKEKHMRPYFMDPLQQLGLYEGRWPSMA